MSTYQKHMAAIMSGEVTKSNVIGIRKGINAAYRAARGWSNSSTAPIWTAPDLNTLHNMLEARRPRVTGDLHETGKKLLRSSRYRKRWNEQQAAIIERLDHFKLIRFDCIGDYSVPVYEAVASTGQSFLFRNIPWQSAYHLGEESGPVIVGES